MREKKEIIKSFRFTDSEIEMIDDLADNFDESQSEVIINSLQLRHELISFISNCDSIDDEDVLQLQELLKITLKSMNIPYQ